MRLTIAWAVALVGLAGCKQYPTIDAVDASVDFPSAASDAGDAGDVRRAAPPAWDVAVARDAEAIPPWDGGRTDPAQGTVQHVARELARCSAPLPAWVRTYGTPAGDEALYAVAEFPSGALLAGGAAPGGMMVPGRVATWWALSLDAAGAVRAQSTGVGAGIVVDVKFAATGLGRPVMAMLTRDTFWTGRGSVFRFDDGAMAPLQDIDNDCDYTARIARGTLQGGLVTVGAGNIRESSVACRSIDFFGRSASAGDLSLSTPGLATSAADGVVPGGERLFVTGWATGGFESRQVFVAEVGGAATSQWYRTFGGLDDDRGVAAGILPDGTRLVLATMYPEDGVRDSDVVLLALDPTGNLLWSRRYGVDSVDEEARDLVVLPDGLAIVASVAERGGARPWVLRTALDGGLRWATTVGVAPIRAGLATATADNGLVLAGTTLGAQSDGWLAKISMSACP